MTCLSVRKSFLRSCSLRGRRYFWTGCMLLRPAHQMLRAGWASRRQHSLLWNTSLLMCWWCTVHRPGFRKRPWCKCREERRVRQPCPWASWYRRWRGRSEAARYYSPGLWHRRKGSPSSGGPEPLRIWSILCNLRNSRHQDKGRRASLPRRQRKGRRLRLRARNDT